MGAGAGVVVEVEGQVAHQGREPADVAVQSARDLLVDVAGDQAVGEQAAGGPYFLEQEVRGCLG